MVLFTSTDFHAETMSQIAELRQTGAFCDVTLTVGQEQIQAHRCVLAARSEYFHTLFLGQFKEASMQNINLSEVTEDATDLEQVVDFIYTGKIDINDDNIELLVELSTYLLIKSLRESCVQYMEDHASLKTCLNSYLCCVKHSLDEMEKSMKLVIMSRFHDYFIHDDNLNLTPDEVQVLWSKGMFQYCTVNSILEFLFKWLKDEATEQHVSVASQILDTAGNNLKVTECLTERQKCESKDLIIKIEENLHYQTRYNVKMFLLQLRKFSCETFNKHELGETKCKVVVGSNSASSDSPILDIEEVIVTLSPKQCVVDEFNKRYPHTSMYSMPNFTEPTFTLSCYIPSTKSWHHIQYLKNEEAVADLPKQYRREKVKMVLCKGEIVLVRSNDCRKVYFYNFRNKVWRVVDMPDLETYFFFSKIVVHDYCLINEDSCLYLILKMIKPEKDMTIEILGEFFVGYRLDEEGNVQKIFETSMVERHCDYYNVIYTELQAKVSSVSNELIFTYGSRLNPADTMSDKEFSYVFIVNLKDQQPVVVNLFKERNEAPKKGLTGVKILTTSTHFYIVYDGTVESQYKDVRFLYEYEFHSQRLTKSLKQTNQKDGNKAKPQSNTQLPRDEMKAQGDSETCLKTCLKINHHNIEVDTFPCSEEFTVSNRNTFWSFEGDRYCYSNLHEVKIDEERKLTHREHKPPPSCCVTCMTVGELSAELVAQLAQEPEGRFPCM